MVRASHSFSHCCFGRFKFGGISPSYAPYIINWIKFQCLYSLLIRVNQAAVSVSRILLCKVAGHLGQSLVRSQTNRDRNSNGLLDTFMEILTPLFEVYTFHPIEIDETLVYGVSEVLWCFLSDNLDHTAGQFSVKLVIGREDGNLLVGELRVSWPHSTVQRCIRHCWRARRRVSRSSQDGRPSHTRRSSCHSR